MVAALGSLTFAIIEGGERGFDAAPVWVAGVVALLTGAWFVWTEKRVDNPLLDLKFFRSLPFSLATVIALLAFFAYAGFLFISTLYLQNVRGLNPLHAGFATLPLAMQSFFGQYPRHWGDVMAFAAMATLPTLLIFVVFQRWFVRSAVSSGIKG